MIAVKMIVQSLSIFRSCTGPLNLKNDGNLASLMTRICLCEDMRSKWLTISLNFLKWQIFAFFVHLVSIFWNAIPRTGRKQLISRHMPSTNFSIRNWKCQVHHPYHRDMVDFVDKVKLNSHVDLKKPPLLNTHMPKNEKLEEGLMNAVKGLLKT